MKTSELRSYRFRKNYKFTPLFWKLFVSTVVVTGIIVSVIAFDLPVPSVSVASASDMDADQIHDLNMNASLSSEGQNTSNSNEQLPVATDSSIDEITPNTTQAGIATSSTDTKADSPSSSTQLGSADTVPPTEGLFSRTAFVGDSRTEGLLLFSGVKGATDYAIKGLNLKSVLSNAFVINTSGNKVTILTDMKTRSFDKIYVSFGLNELGWSSDTFAKKYSELVHQIREVQPHAAIYLQSTFPINPDRCRFDQNTNKQIQEMNGQVEKIAQTMSNVYYVDLFTHFKDSRGYLLPEASSDGIHLNNKYCTFWLKCLEKDLAGKPLPVQDVAKTDEPLDSVPSATSKTATPVESSPVEPSSTESATQLSDDIKNE